jgi:hypothetical protein
MNRPRCRNCNGVIRPAKWNERKMQHG